MKRLLFFNVLILFLLCNLSAKAFEVDLTFSPAYRCDNLHWTVNSLPAANEITQEQWKNLQILDLSGKIESTLFNHFYVKAEGDYGWILAGTKTYDLDEVGTTFADEWLEARVKGYVYDVSGGVGYKALFFSNQFQLLPLVGYSYSVQHMRDSNYQDRLHLLNVFEDVVSNSTYKWNGPWIGLVPAYLHKYFKVSLEYQFHWSFYRGSIQDNLIDSLEETQKKNCSYGNEFILSLFSSEWRRWKFGLVGNYQFYNGSNGTSTLAGHDGTLSGVHWTSGGISLNLIRVF